VHFTIKLEKNKGDSSAYLVIPSVAKDLHFIKQIPRYARDDEVLSLFSTPLLYLKNSVPLEKMMAYFTDRIHAGQLLAKKLKAYANKPDTLLLGLPRGGVPVAFEVAKILHLPLDCIIVRKLGLPGHEELAMGAISIEGITVFNDEIVKTYGISPRFIKSLIKQKKEEIALRNQLYRNNNPLPDITGKVIILIDDGLATGATMRAGISVVRTLKPKTLIVAIPVSPSDTCAELTKEVDKMICLKTPEPFYGVGLWYDNFAQTSDKEVQKLLHEAKAFGFLGFNSSR